MIVKIFLTVELDEDDYPIPVDGMVEEDVNETVHNLIHDVDGMSIKSIKIITE